VSRRMGLFVVARLAARHGIRVRLRPAASGGLIALAWLPDEAIMHEAPGGSSGPRVGSGVSEHVIGPVTDGVFAGANGALTSAWGDIGHGTTAEQEADVTKAPPKYASLRADSEEPGLGPKRVPGAGPRPGASWETTGPAPAFRTVPRPASNGGSEPAATGPQPAAAAGPVASAGAAAGPGAQTPAGAEDADAPTGAFDPFATVSGPGNGGADAPSGGFDPFATVSGPGNGGADAPTGGFDPFATVSGPGNGGADAPTGAFDPFATLSQPGNGGTDAPASPSPVLGAPAATWEASTTHGPVIVPPADDLEARNRLPIFEAVESDWFRRGRHAVGRPDHDGEAVGNGWASPADEGWRAAEVVHAPSSGGVTSAGLPKRVPRANLVPGAASVAESSTLAPARSPAATRDRFSSFQRGSRQGRAAATETDSDGGEDENSG
jgi:hypothetical protein